MVTYHEIWMYVRAQALVVTYIGDWEIADHDEVGPPVAEHFAFRVLAVVPGPVSSDLMPRHYSGQREALF